MKHLFSLLILFSSTQFLAAQTLWKKNQTPSAALQMPEEESLPTSFQLLELNPAVFQKAVSNAPLASNLVQTNNVATQRNEQSCVDIPLPDGSIECFALEQTQLLPQATQRRNNDIKTYRGRSLSNPKAIVHIVQSNNDFHLIGDSDQGTFFINKVEKKDTKQPLYISYLAKDEQIEALECEVAHGVERNAPVSSARNSETKKSFGATLRKYRMAIMWSHVYTPKYNNNTSQILAKSAEFVADMNFFCERDLCITFVLADNPEKVIFTDEATDPYDGLLGSIGYTLRDSIGAENFDIGFGIAQGGNLSFRPVTCSSQKGFTRSADHIRAIAHELGHNMGAQHTFDYCEHGLAAIRVEVGGGHSIMSYNGTGVCGAGAVAGDLVYRYHSRSVEEMYQQLYIDTDCAEKTPTNNVPPVVSVPTSGFYIPQSTPFALTGTVSDANTDMANLTYDWDQIDNGAGSVPTDPDDKAPLFRLYAHSTSPTRTFPKISNLVNGDYSEIGEKLPTVSRSLSFRFQAQDNHPGGSGVANDDVQFFVDGTKGPFVVTYPNLNETQRIYSVGHDLNVTWDVANTQQAPISCANVDIYLSNDGGLTYPFTLATNVPNDGAQQVVIPDAVGDNNRIKVAAADNIFFDISDRDFKIVGADGYDFIAYTDQATYDNCGSEEDIIISLVSYPIGTFDKNLSLSLTGLPANASLNMPSLINTDATTSITIGNIAQVPVGTYSLVLTLTEEGGGLSKTIPLELAKQDDILTTAPDKAAEFSGSNSRIIINKNSDFNFGTSGSFSFDAWIYPTNLDDSYRTFIGDQKVGSLTGWKFYMRDSELFFSLRQSNDDTKVNSGAVLRLNEWQHIACTIDRGAANSIKLYLDGKVVASTNASAVNINTSNNLVIGARDRYTLYKDNFEGQMDEANIWNRALSTLDIWKKAHVIVEHCDDGLISTYQFNETSGNQALDAFRGHHGNLGGVTRVVCSAPFGKGTASHQIEVPGLVNFEPTGFSAEYTNQQNINVVASKIDLAPFNPSEGINPDDAILSGQYWIIRQYDGAAEVEYDGTFTLNDPISTQEASTAVAYKLYVRDVLSAGSWTFVTAASTADATNNSITFKGIQRYGQFLITRNEESLLFVEEEEILFCATPQGEVGLRSYGVSGINLTQDVAITAPTDYQLATNPAGPFSTSLSLPLVGNALSYTLVYVKFEPTVMGETQGIITHVAGAQSVNKPVKGIQVTPAQDIADKALQLDGTDAALQIENGEDIDLSGHTVEMWFKPNWADLFKHRDERWATLFAKQQGTDIAISASVTGEQIRIRRGSSNTYIDHVFSSTQWYHLALVFSTNNTAVYINGVQLSTSASAYDSSLSHYPIYLGGNGTGQFFEGKIDEFKIWNVGKNITQVREGMHLTSNVSSGCEAGLRVYHQFDQLNSDGNMEDKLYYHAGIPIADAVLAYSDVPAAEGVSVTKVVGDIGTYVFDKDGITTNLTIDYTAGAPSREVVVSYLTGEGAHGNFPTRGKLEDAYWIIKDYGVTEGGGINMFIKNPTDWLLNEDIITNKVYKRKANAEDTNPWSETGTVLAISLAEDVLTLQDTVSSSLQLVPSRGYEGTCFDGIMNGDEVDIDCGGSCPCVECDYTQIAYTNFDNGNPFTSAGKAQIYGIWNIPSGPTGLSTDANWAKSGERSVKLLGSNSSPAEFSTKNMNLNGYDNLELDFWFTPTGFYRPNSVFYLEISTDGGASYSIVKTWEWSGEFTRNYTKFNFVDLPDDLEYTRYHENITINEPLTSNTRLRFRTNFYYARTIYLDNVKISACKLPTCTDGVQNGIEVAIDCGGDCPNVCDLPTATISGTTAVCQNEAAPSLTFSGADGTAPYTFTYKINDGVEQTITTTAGNNIAINHPTNVVGTFTYTLVKVQDADNGEQNQTGTATATIEALPTASISGTATVSEGAAAPSVTFTAANGTAPYTFTYKLNNGAAQTITNTAGNSVTLTQSTASVGMFEYELVSITDDKGCNNTATGSAVVTVTATQLPTATISGTTTVCKDGVSPSITFTGADGVAPYTFTYKINDGAEQTTTTTAGNSTSIDHPTDVAGTFAYTLVTVQDANNLEQNLTGAATITVEELPTASISGTTTVSQGTAAPSLTFTGADGVAPYTFTYKVNDGAEQTITTTTGNSVTIEQSTASAGMFEYDLVNVTGNNSCSNAATGNAVVTVTENQLPTATISGTTTACQYDISPNLTFTGADGTAPYTFTYKINDGAEQSRTTSSGNSYSIFGSTNSAGTFVYTLVKVKDANNLEQNLTGTATVTVEALPTASISGTTTVSQGAVAPNVTFTGANGTVPYTFMYKINNGAAQSITTTAGNTVTVEQLTASTGMFEYELVSVTDNNGCSDVANGSAIVTVDTNVAPSSDICNQAIEIKDLSNCPTIHFNNLGATAENDGIGCNPENGMSIWYVFTATVSTVEIKGIDFNSYGSDNAITIESYSGDCSALNYLNCQVICESGCDFMKENLVIGQKYYLKVYATSVMEGDFCIEALNGNICNDVSITLNMDTTNQATYQTNQSAQLSGKVIEGDSTNVTAGQVITLLPGFHVEAGSQFHAQIAACTPNTYAPITPATERITNPINETAPAISTLKDLIITPNPFYQSTTIKYALSEETEVSLHIYGMDGQLVNQIMTTTSQAKGVYEYTFEPNMHSGNVYFAVLITSSEVVSKKMIFIR